MSAYEITTINRREIGPAYAKTIQTVYEQSVAHEVPGGAISLEELRAAEMARAAKARELWGNAGLLGILIDGENGRTGQTADMSLPYLVRGLPTGSVVWDQIEQVAPSKLNEAEANRAFAHLARS